MQYVTFLWDFSQITYNHQSNTNNDIYKYDFLNIKFIKFHGIPWNSMEIQKSSVESMEFQGTWSAPI